MEEQTPVTTEPSQAATTPETTTEPETDWDEVARKIAAEIQKTQPTYQAVTATHGQEIGEFRVVHEVTIGDLLISFLLCVIVAIQLVKWFSNVVWGR